jgi:hypothetical protein
VALWVRQDEYRPPVRVGRSGEARWLWTYSTVGGKRSSGMTDVPGRVSPLQAGAVAVYEIMPRANCKRVARDCLTAAVNAMGNLEIRDLAVSLGAESTSEAECVWYRKVLLSALLEDSYA